MFSKVLIGITALLNIILIYCFISRGIKVSNMYKELKRLEEMIRELEKSEE